MGQILNQSLKVNKINNNINKSKYWYETNEQEKKEMSIIISEVYVLVK